MKEMFPFFSGIVYCVLITFLTYKYFTNEKKLCFQEKEINHLKSLQIYYRDKSDGFLFEIKQLKKQNEQSEKVDCVYHGGL